MATAEELYAVAFEQEIKELTQAIQAKGGEFHFEDSFPYVSYDYEDEPMIVKAVMITEHGDIDILVESADGDWECKISPYETHYGDCMTITEVLLEE